MRRALLVVAVTLSSGCGVQFSPETLVDTLRVLSLTAEPPEVAPGEPTTLGVLYADPSRVGEPNTIIWVGCEPDPQDLGRSACNDASILVKPSLITDYPPGLQLLGFGPTATYRASAGVFDPLGPDDPIRQSGSVGQVLAIVLEGDIPLTATGPELADLFRKVETKELRAVISLSRVLVSERAQKNRNPVVEGLTFDGAPLPTGARLQVRPGQEVHLGVSVPDASRETWVEQQPSGPVEKREAVVGAWYSTHGRFSRERFDVAAPDDTTFTAPGSAAFPEDPVPEKRLGQLWLVLRDSRGGQAHQAFRFFVCDETLPTPQVTAITPPSTPDEPVVVSGQHLANVLDVVIGDAALVRSAYSQVRGAFIGTAPALPPGTYPVTVRGQNCVNQDTGLTYTVP